MATLEVALRIAADAHAGQTDKEGLPYILHPLRVMHLVTAPAARIVAVLHDVVEDTPVTLDDLRAAGFADEIVEAVRLVTRFPGQSYTDYVVAAKANPVAVAVKLADLTDNSRLDRTIIRPQRFAADQRRITKYLVSYKFLTGAIDEPTYRQLMVPLEDPPRG